MDNKKAIIIVFYFGFLISMSGQALHISYGPIFTKSKAISPIINANEDFSNTTAVKAISYEHFSKKNISFIGTYNYFRGSTYINFAIGGYKDFGGSDIGGEGWYGTNIYRFDLLVAYKLTKLKRYYFKPFGGIGLQASRSRGIGIFQNLVNGPDYIGIEPTEAEPYNTFQITPTGGIKTGFVFWKRLDIGLQVQGVYGYKPYQKLTLKYKYKGIVQPNAIYASDGTGLFYTFSIGYRFARFIK
jgi:hypothetical protein